MSAYTQYEHAKPGAQFWCCLQELPDLALEVTEPVRESRSTAQGDGCGLLLMASSSGGRCIMGAAGLGQPGQPAEAVAQQAAQELVADLRTGGCLDRWCAVAAVRVHHSSLQHERACLGSGRAGAAEAACRSRGPAGGCT